jgi:hypothetical protein
LATTPAIVQSIVTTFYTDDANFSLRANSDSDLLRFEVMDSGNSGRTVKWVVKCETAEATYNTAVT